MLRMLSVAALGQVEMDRVSHTWIAAHHQTTGLSNIDGSTRRRRLHRAISGKVGVGEIGS